MTTQKFRKRKKKEDWSTKTLNDINTFLSQQEHDNVTENKNNYDLKEDNEFQFKVPTHRMSDLLNSGTTLSNQSNSLLSRTLSSNDSSSLLLARRAKLKTRLNKRPLFGNNIDTQDNVLASSSSTLSEASTTQTDNTNIGVNVSQTLTNPTSLVSSSNQRSKRKYIRKRKQKKARKKIALSSNTSRRGRKKGIPSYKLRTKMAPIFQRNYKEPSESISSYEASLPPLIDASYEPIASRTRSGKNKNIKDKQYKFKLEDDVREDGKDIKCGVPGAICFERDGSLCEILECDDILSDRYGLVHHVCVPQNIKDLKEVDALFWGDNKWYTCDLVRLCNDDDDIMDWFVKLCAENKRFAAWSNEMEWIDNGEFDIQAGQVYLSKRYGFISCKNVWVDKEGTEFLSGILQLNGETVIDWSRNIIDIIDKEDTDANVSKLSAWMGLRRNHICAHMIYRA